MQCTAQEMAANPLKCGELLPCFAPQLILLLIDRLRARCFSFRNVQRGDAHFRCVCFHWLCDVRDRFLDSRLDRCYSIRLLRRGT